MTKERDYLTLDEVEEYTGIKKNSLYYYLKTLDIKTHKFTLDRRAYISLEDANRIKEVKEMPWLAGEKVEKSSVSITEQEPIQPVTSNPRVDTPKKKVSQNRTIVGNTQGESPMHEDLPPRTIKLWDFIQKHGLPHSSVGRWIEKGLKGEIIETTTRTRTNGAIQHYLTPEQQEKAVEILKRHGKLKKLLPEGSMLADDFAKAHGIDPFDFDSHMREGLGPGLIGMSTETIPQRDQVDYSERKKPNRPGETEKYLTADQQKAALAFWKRQHVDYSQCDQAGCPCHS